MLEMETHDNPCGLRLFSATLRKSVNFFSALVLCDSSSRILLFLSGSLGWRCSASERNKKSLILSGQQFHTQFPRTGFSSCGAERILLTNSNFVFSAKQQQKKYWFRFDFSTREIPQKQTIFPLKAIFWQQQ